MTEGRCLATLGAFDDRGDGWLVELDVDRPAPREVVRFEPPAPLRVPGKGFTGGAWLPDGRLALCASAAICLVADGAVVDLWASPGFNDLHGLAADGDRVWVVNTGLDAVEIFDLGGRFVGALALEPHWLASRRMNGQTPSRAAWPGLLDARWSGTLPDFTPEAPAGDYYRDNGAPFARRRVRDRLHPNHVALVDGRPWITCLAPSAVIDGVDFRIRARFDAPPHDGLPRGDRIWFTRVDGVVEARALDDPARCVERHDVSAAAQIFGWCRGLHVTDELLWVGFTEMRRPARFAWSRAPLTATATAVVCLDRKSSALVRRFDLDDGGRHIKVGGLLAPGGAGR